MNNKFNLEKEVSCRVTNSALKYIEPVKHKTGSTIEDVSHTYERLTDPLNWVVYAVREQSCQRAAKFLGDEAIIFQGGLATRKLNPLGVVKHVVRLLDSPKLVYKAIPTFTTCFDSIFRFKTTPANNKKTTVTMVLPNAYTLSKDSGYYAKGILTAIPTLWALPPDKIHQKQCMCQPRDESGMHSTHFDPIVVASFLKIPDVKLILAQVRSAWSMYPEQYQAKVESAKVNLQ